MTTFNELGVSPEIVKALEEHGIINPTEIQENAIPVILENDPDFIGMAQTGTGKTAAFGIPLLEMIDPGMNKTQALVLAPTRELAQQIAKELSVFSKYQEKVKVEVVYGGASIVDQMKSIKRKTPQVVIATPGRLIDLAKRKAINLGHVDWVILDEADEMLNMGFKDELDKILAFTPEDKRTWLFSATMPSEIRKLVKLYMHDPLEVKVNRKKVVNENIEHRFKTVRKADKPLALKRLIDFYPEMYGVVFCRTKIETQRLSQDLVKSGYAVEALHGDLSQAQRDQVMARFRAGNVKVLLATDVAARGIDVDNLTHVIHYALPDDKEYYTHRSGRTARAGKKGVSIALISPDDRRKLDILQSRLGIKMDQAKLPSLQEVTINRVTSWAEGVMKFEHEPVDQNIMETIKSYFEDYTKEELLEQFIAAELQKLNNAGERDDLNYTIKKGEGGDGNRRDRRDRDRGRGRGKGKEKGMDTFFINIGSVDKVNKGELLRMVCDISGIRGKDVGAIRVNKNHTFFDVKDSKSKGLEKKFKGMEFRGRKIRMNKE
ncbi:MAG: DEAD/DEAH box helicase [Schleiferiaceae bacterium]|nr:DEAD/DEAH box helicase [Schleiferiaceae bacterium]